MKNIVTNALYKQDIEESITSIVSLEKLQHKSILVTGASGLIGSAIVDLLLALNENHFFDMSIFACGRDLANLEHRFGSDRKGLYLVNYDTSVKPSFDFSVDYMIHGASPASPDLYVSKPVETMTSNFLGMYNLLEFAKNKEVSKVVYISSSEVYGTGVGQEAIVEDFIGNLDHLNVRSSYASSKRATETLCISYAEEYGLDVTIVRPGHIYGPSAQKNDKRVSSYFMTEAIKGHDIVMKSEGMQLRSYCYSLDCASAILSVLLKGKSAQSYNISNAHSVITIREMAKIIANVAEVTLKFDLPTEAEQKQSNPMSNASLNSQKLEDLGWKGLFDADTGFVHTYKILKG